MTAADAGDFAAGLAGLRVCVAGLGVSGPPAARVLAARGAQVTAVDSRDDDDQRAIAAELAGHGIAVALGDGAVAALPDGTDLVVTSPGWTPDSPLLAAAAAAGVEVMGDVELAWRLRPWLDSGLRQQWLAVTGTNGKTTTVRMLALMLKAAGYRALKAGNVGTSLAEVVTDPVPYQVVAVELSSFQLYWSSTIAPKAAAVLNVAAHHLDWHGTFEAYAAAKSKIFAAGTFAIGNADDERSAAMVSAAMVSAAGSAGAPATALFRLGEPGPGELGVADGFLVDRAFCGGSGGPGVRLAPVADLARGVGQEDRVDQGERVGRDESAGRRRRRTSSPTRSRRRPWPGPTAHRPRRSAPGYAASGLTRTGLAWSAALPGWPTSTTPRRRTRTRPPHRSLCTTRWSGRPAAC